MSTKQVKKVWAYPIILGLITTFGLLAALLGIGFWYWLSWLAMALPLAIIVQKVWFNKTATKGK